jgi:hypothetical protein
MKLEEIINYLNRKELEETNNLQKIVKEINELNNILLNEKIKQQKETNMIKFKFPFIIKSTQTPIKSKQSSCYYWRESEGCPKTIKFKRIQHWQIIEELNYLIFVPNVSSPPNAIKINIGQTINNYLFLGLL